MPKVSFPVLEGFKRVFFMLVAILFCVLAWLALSVIAGQTVHSEPVGMYTVYMGGRLIGSH
jgi:hypothetical protein